MLHAPDLIAGVVASALLLALVFALGLDVMPSLVLAVGAYLGLRLALPRPASTAAALSAAEALRRCEQRVTEIRQLARRRSASSVDEPARQLWRIGERAGQIVAVLRDDPAKGSVAEAYLTGYLDPIQAVVSRYVLLGERDVSSAAAALARAELETLPSIEHALDRLYDRLHTEDVIDLEVASEMLDLRFEGHLDTPR